MGFDSEFERNNLKNKEIDIEDIEKRRSKITEAIKNQFKKFQKSGEVGFLKDIMKIGVSYTGIDEYKHSSLGSMGEEEIADICVMIRLNSDSLKNVEEIIDQTSGENQETGIGDQIKNSEDKIKNVFNPDEKQNPLFDKFKDTNTKPLFFYKLSKKVQEYWNMLEKKENIYVIQFLELHINKDGSIIDRLDVWHNNINYINGLCKHLLEFGYDSGVEKKSNLTFPGINYETPYLYAIQDAFYKYIGHYNVLDSGEIGTGTDYDKYTELRPIGLQHTHKSIQKYRDMLEKNENKGVLGIIDRLMNDDGSFNLEGLEKKDSAYGILKKMFKRAHEDSNGDVMKMKEQLTLKQRKLDILEKINNLVSSYNSSGDADIVSLFNNTGEDSKMLQKIIDRVYEPPQDGFLIKPKLENIDEKTIDFIKLRMNLDNSICDAIEGIIYQLIGEKQETNTKSVEELKQKLEGIDLRPKGLPYASTGTKEEWARWEKAGRFNDLKIIALCIQDNGKFIVDNIPTATFPNESPEEIILNDFLNKMIDRFESSEKTTEDINEKYQPEGLNKTSAAIQAYRKNLEKEDNKEAMEIIAEYINPDGKIKEYKDGWNFCAALGYTADEIDEVYNHFIESTQISIKEFSVSEEVDIKELSPEGTNYLYKQFFNYIDMLKKSKVNIQENSLLFRRVEEIDQQIKILQKYVEKDKIVNLGKIQADRESYKLFNDILQGISSDLGAEEEIVSIFERRESVLRPVGLKETSNIKQQQRGKYTKEKDWHAMHILAEDIDFNKDTSKFKDYYDLCLSFGYYLNKIMQVEYTDYHAIRTQFDTIKNIEPDPKEAKNKEEQEVPSEQINEKPIIEETIEKIDTNTPQGFKYASDQAKEYRATLDRWKNSDLKEQLQKIVSYNADGTMNIIPLGRTFNSDLSGKNNYVDHAEAKELAEKKGYRLMDDYTNFTKKEDYEFTDFYRMVSLFNFTGPGDKLDTQAAQEIFSNMAGASKLYWTDTYKRDANGTQYKKNVSVRNLKRLIRVRRDPSNSAIACGIKKNKDLAPSQEI